MDCTTSLISGIRCTNRLSRPIFMVIVLEGQLPQAPSNSSRTTGPSISTTRTFPLEKKAQGERGMGGVVAGCHRHTKIPTWFRYGLSSAVACENCVWVGGGMRVSVCTSRKSLGQLESCVIVRHRRRWVGLRLIVGVSFIHALPVITSHRCRTLRNAHRSKRYGVSTTCVHHQRLYIRDSSNHNVHRKYLVGIVAWLGVIFSLGDAIAEHNEPVALSPHVPSKRKTRKHKLQGLTPSKRFQLRRNKRQETDISIAAESHRGRWPTSISHAANHDRIPTQSPAPSSAVAPSHQTEKYPVFDGEKLWYVSSHAHHR